MLPTIVTVNPFMAKHKPRQHAQHKRRARRSHGYRAINRFPKRRRKTHINPFRALSARGLTHDVTAALVGAGGAVLTDVGMAYAAPYLPASLQSGWLNVLARAAMALGVGFVAGKVVGRDTGKAVAAGGLIVVAYSGLKQALAPTLGTSIKGLSGLADFGDYRPAYGGESLAMVGGGGMGAYMQPRIGAYMSPGSVLAPANVSPLRAKQMGAYMRGGLGSFGGGSGYSEDM